MELLTAEDLPKLDWKPRHYVDGLDGTHFGYDKAVDPRYAIEGLAVDFVRLQSGLVIPEHYHTIGVENFVVEGGEAVFQTRRSTDEKRNEKMVKPGDMIRINPGVLHRVINESSEPFYLWRHAIKLPDDSVFTEFPELFQQV